MKRAFLAVCGILLCAPALAGGGRGHFSPHTFAVHPATHEMGRLRDIFARPAPQEIGRIGRQDIITPPMAHMVGPIRPGDIITPPMAHMVGPFRPSDIITPPMAHTAGLIHPTDIITPPLAHTTSLDSTVAHLVKPAWAE